MVQASMIDIPTMTLYERQLEIERGKEYLRDTKRAEDIDYQSKHFGLSAEDKRDLENAINELRQWKKEDDEKALKDIRKMSRELSIENKAAKTRLASYSRSNSRKEGRAISHATQSRIDDHIDNLNSIASEAEKAMRDVKKHVSRVRTAADDFADTIQGAEQPYTAPNEGTPDPGQQEGKHRRGYGGKVWSAYNALQKDRSRNVKAFTSQSTQSFAK